jgi:hypothetical protein
MKLRRRMVGTVGNGLVVSPKRSGVMYDVQTDHPVRTQFAIIRAAMRYQYKYLF